MDTRSYRPAVAFALAALLLSAAVLIAQPDRKASPPATPEFTALTPSDIVWKDGPSSLVPGIKLAVLHGSPEAAGPFVIRLKFPKGLRVPAHTHPGNEQVTILSGNVVMGFGKRPEGDQVRTLPAGSFVLIPAGVVHHVVAEEETVMQLNGVGPWGIEYADPATDPRNKK